MKLRKVAKRLMTIPSINLLSSTAVAAATRKDEAFERGRDFAACLGLVSRQNSTRGWTLLEHITKRGSKYLQTLFVLAAQVIVMRPQSWHKFSFGRWLEGAATRMQHNKPGVALANKLARIAWSVLSSGIDFDGKDNEIAGAI